jgi:hypothetical protein
MWACKWLYHILEYILSDICLGVESLDHMIVIVLVFRGTSILLSIAAALIYIPFPPTPLLVAVYVVDHSYFD